MINITKVWTSRFSPPSSGTKRNEKITVWASPFSELLRLSPKERKLNQTALLTYRRPRTLCQQLTKYKTIAHETDDVKSGESVPCGKCALCGNHGIHKNMVVQSSQIKSLDGKLFNLSKRLKCGDWGIYAATCRRCGMQYVGQTMTSFSTRWNTHRSVWKNGTTSNNNDAAALKTHYTKYHQDHVNIDISLAFSVTFVDKPDRKSRLDFSESVWINRLEAVININKTLLPKVM